MKRSIVFLFFMLMAFGAVAQSISVKSFRALPMDMTASSLKGKRVDQNGQVAALIKIVTSETGFTFEGGTLGIVDSKQENGEVWVWVPRASRKITIKHQQLGVLRDYRYPIEIEAERTYEMVLITAEIETIIKEKITQQYLIFELEPKNAILEVNEQLWNVDADGTAMQYVDFGTYTYRVRAANYSIEAGVVTVEDPDNPVTINVTLRPNLAQVTLTVDADAEIWVNNEKKGVRTWTGPLSDGTYKVECKQEGHETMIVSQKITAEMNGQTITLPAPKPIYGSLNVESNPNLATLYIDGKEIGKTPRPINEILVGQHELRLTKEGYKDHVETIVIAKGERKLVRATLDADGSVPVVEKPKKPEMPKPTVSTPENNVFFIMANAAYSLAPQTSFGLTVGSLKRWGWYASVGTNFKYVSANYYCAADGTISSNTSNYYHYTKQETIRFSATAGAVARIYKPLCVYFGAGYGVRNLLWHFEGNVFSGIAKNTAYSHEGVTLDAGMMFHLGHFSGSLGVQTVNFGYVEAKLGLGVNF